MITRFVFGALLLVCASYADAEEAIKAGQSFKDCPHCPEMVVVPNGSFNMGSPESEPQRDKAGTESPPHKVSIATPFAVGRFSVTRDEFDAFVTDSGYKVGGSCFIRSGGQWKEYKDISYRAPGFRQTGSEPAVCVNWEDAKAYVAWLSQKTGKTYRLLSEAEREYVTRAGTETPFWCGSTITPQQANYDGSANAYQGGGEQGEYRQRTLPVASLQANPFGLYQVHGNAGEWVEDCWHANYFGAPADGSAWVAGDCNLRVFRGGAWNFKPQSLRAASRGRTVPAVRSDYIGFRVARAL
jgi:formylglycine-generating enzyme required for sulfatase activity